MMFRRESLKKITLLAIFTLVIGIQPVWAMGKPLLFKKDANIIKFTRTLILKKRFSNSKKREERKWLRNLQLVKEFLLFINKY